MFNEKKFKAKLVECGLSVTDVAKALGINEATLYRKIKGTSDFSRNELTMIKSTLGMTISEFEEVFFACELA